MIHAIRGAPAAECLRASGLTAGGRFAAWAPAVPRYVVLDVDGTVLAGGRRATRDVASCGRRAAAAGVELGFATGRLPAGIEQLARQLAAAGPHVVHNGAQVVADGRPLWTSPLSTSAARALVDRCLAAEVYAEFYAGERVLVTDRRSAAQPIWQLISGAPAGLIGEVDLDRTEIIKSTVVAFDTPEVDRVLGIVRACGLVAECAGSAALPQATFINAVAPEVGKGPALRRAAAHLQLDLSQVVALGDGPNDLSMLEVAGTAIAMGHAPLEVRQAAHLITADITRDGAARALAAVARWQPRRCQLANG